MTPKRLEELHTMYPMFESGQCEGGSEQLDPIGAVANPEDGDALALRIIAAIADRFYGGHSTVQRTGADWRVCFGRVEPGSRHSGQRGRTLLAATVAAVESTRFVTGDDGYATVGSAA